MLNERDRRQKSPITPASYVHLQLAERVASTDRAAGNADVRRAAELRFRPAQNGPSWGGSTRTLTSLDHKSSDRSECLNVSRVPVSGRPAVTRISDVCLRGMSPPIDRGCLKACSSGRLTVGVDWLDFDFKTFVIVTNHLRSICEIIIIIIIKYYHYYHCWTKTCC